MGCGLSKQQFLLPQPIGLEHSRNAILSLISPEQHALAMQLFVRYDLENRMHMEEEFTMKYGAAGAKRGAASKMALRQNVSAQSPSADVESVQSNASDTVFMGFEWSNTLLRELQTDSFKKNLQNLKLSEIRYNEIKKQPSSSAYTDPDSSATPPFAKSSSHSTTGVVTLPKGSPSNRAIRVNSSSSLKNNFVLPENERPRSEGAPHSTRAQNRSTTELQKTAHTPVTPILSPVSANSFNVGKVSVVLSIDMATSRWYGAFYFQDKTHVVQDSDMIASQIAGKRNIKYDPNRLISRTNTTLDLAEMARVSFEELQKSTDGFSSTSSLPFHKEDILGKMFAKMKALATKKISEFIFSDTNIDISNVVVTVPSSIGNMERQKLGKACQKAGMHLIRVLTGSTAAALHVGHEIPTDHEAFLLVYNHGYSVLDISVMKVHFGIFEMLASVGDCTIGGNAFTSNLAAYMREQYIKTFSTSLSEEDTREKLLKHAEMLKKQLSTQDSVSVLLENIFENDLEVGITRTRFETLNKGLYDRCQKLLIQALADAKLDRSRVTHVITVGSTTKMHGIAELLQRDFQKHLMEHRKHDVVVKGAALQAANCQQDLQASGATGGISFVMVDVYPFRVNIELNDGLCIELIPPLSSIPFKATKIFTTVEDNQKGIHIRLFEYNTLQTRDDQQLAGEFKFNGLPEMPKKEAIIEITVGIKENQEMRVFAVCKYGSMRTKLNRLRPGDQDWEQQYPLPEFIFQKSLQG